MLDFSSVMKTSEKRYVLCTHDELGLIFGLSLQRVDAAKTRIESLNSLVTVEALAHHEMTETESLEALVMSVDLVCVTDWNRAGLVGLILPNFRSHTLNVLDPYQ